MKGKILDYNIQESKGIISGDDNQRYEFINSEWKSDRSPAKNQIVDFEIDGKNANAIYLESSQLFDSNDLKEKISNINNSETFKNAKSKIKGTLKEGAQNKFGFVVSILFGIALFLPILKVPLLGTASLLDGGLGKFCLFLVIILSVMFYSGVKHFFVKIVSGIVLFIVFIQFYDLFTDLYNGSQALSAFGGGRSSVNLFSLLQFGTFIIIPLVFILFYTSFKKKYTEKATIK